MNKEKQGEIVQLFEEILEPGSIYSLPERGCRLFEEAGEAMQSCGASREIAHLIVDRIWDNPPGALPQEIAGVSVTLSILAHVADIDLEFVLEQELARVRANKDQIRAKQAIKRTQGITAYPSNGG
jgi:NTP pyrophosphatase (non-canonical NTP hydrolase)